MLVQESWCWRWLLNCESVRGPLICLGGAWAGRLRRRYPPCQAAVPGHRLRQWLRYRQCHERQRTTPARRAFHECRMQFPQHRATPRNHIVGIATFVDTVESSPNRIACETAPSARELPAFLAARGDPCVTCLPVASPSNGGNCTIRGATRRRHAEGRLLMLQNPPLPLVSCSLTGAGLPGGRHTAPRCDLTASKRGELRCTWTRA